MTTESLHRLWRALSIGALVALLIVPVAAFAQEAGEARQMGAPKHHAAPAPSEPTGEQAKPGGESAGPSEEAKASAPAAAAPILPPPVITHHNIGLDGSNLSYGAKAGMLPLRDAQDKTIASIFYVAYCARAARHQAADHLRLQWRSGRCIGLSASRRDRSQDRRGQRQGRVARPPSPPRRQRCELARLHRSRLRRSGRHRL